MSYSYNDDGLSYVDVTPQQYQYTETVTSSGQSYSPLEYVTTSGNQFLYNDPVYVTGEQYIGGDPVNVTPETKINTTTPKVGNQTNPARSGSGGGMPIGGGSAPKLPTNQSQQPFALTIRNIIPGAYGADTNTDGTIAGVSPIVWIAGAGLLAYVLSKKK